MSTKIQLKIKEEIKKLLKIGFIKPTRYVKWLSNIVPVMKKNGKLLAYVDFKDINAATLKDVYVMQATHHKKSWKVGLSPNRILSNLPSSEAVKGQALVDFLANHPCLDVMGTEGGLVVNEIYISLWVLKFDVSSTESSARIEILFESLTGTKTTLSFNLDFECTNNQVKNEALLIGLEILQELGAKPVKVIGDPQLVLKQLSREYKYNSISLTPYFALAIQLLESFEEIEFEHLSRERIGR
ncbi:hypothetical protein GH714_007634 [Hevea brasiliensis]|uniref:RNase H type-1 domain-containing protein n=1 Tax=Hevea brasiliensis TaxID=3981 RepID=A0A6A6MY87_HEVBR|nr:hypothetical protein GH714_007634 [Hevea brasiliensis]